MTKFNYTEEAKILSEVIEVAIDSIKRFPPKEFDERHISHFVNTYIDFKNKALSPEPRYKNLQSLASLKKDVLIYFQEGKGEAVHYFWKMIIERKLGYKRENKLAKILNRQKIKNQSEYDFIIDVLVPYHQQGIIDTKDLSDLNKLIGEYESK